MASMKIWFVILVLCVVVIGFGVTTNAQSPDQRFEKAVDAAVLQFERKALETTPEYAKIWSDPEFLRAEVRPRLETLLREMLLEQKFALNSQEFWSRCMTIGKEIAEAAKRILENKTVARS